MVRNLLAIAVIVCATSAQAATVVISNFDVRATGIFGHADATGTLNGSAFPGANFVADPLTFEITYANLDLDGDLSANDTVSFTLQATKFGPDGGNLRAMNQGVDTGFGNLNDVEFSVIDVVGTTTDFGDTIVFDGFTAATAAFGRTGDIDSSVEVNGITASALSADTGAFQFIQDKITFGGPTATVTFDNSSSIGGTVVARNYDLQFSTVTTAIPEPSSLAVLGISGVGFVLRRKRS
ncbi:MAG: PEP-CTERM sorting domain-containing protein [Planctomycetota bacterium]